MEPEKTVRNSIARSLRFDEPLSGYEIHLGRTEGPDTERPAIFLNDAPDGATSADGKVFGCYLHGLFEAAGFRQKLLQSLGVDASSIDHRANLEAALDEIAAELEQHLDVDAILAAAR